MKNMVKDEISRYGEELRVSRKREDKELKEKYGRLSEDLLDELLTLYLERVKFIHAFAFL